MSDYQKQIESITLGIGNLTSDSIQRSRRITDDQENKAAANVLAQIKTKSKEIKAKKKSILDPLNAAIKEVRELFADPEKRLAEAEERVKAAILAYHEEKDAAAQKQITSIENRIGPGRGKLKVETAMAQLAGVDQAEAHIRGEEGGAQVRLGPEKVRITDARLLLDWHKEYLTRERVLEAIRLEVAADIKAGAPVPEGAELYRERVVAGITL